MHARIPPAEISIIIVTGWRDEIPRFLHYHEEGNLTNILVLLVNEVFQGSIYNVFRVILNRIISLLLLFKEEINSRVSNSKGVIYIL